MAVLAVQKTEEQVAVAAQAELGMMRCNAIGGVLDFSPKQQWLDQIIQSHGFETCGSGARCLASKSQLLYT